MSGSNKIIIPGDFGSPDHVILNQNNSNNQENSKEWDFNVYNQGFYHDQGSTEVHKITTELKRFRFKSGHKDSVQKSKLHN